MNTILQKNIVLDGFDYYILRKQTKYLLSIGFLAMFLGAVVGFLIGYLRSSQLYGGLLGSTILASIFVAMWLVFFICHLLTYLTRKTTIEGTVIQKSIQKQPKGNPLYCLHFAEKQYNVPLSFYKEVSEGRQVRLHFSNILFLFIRGEVL